MRKSYNPPKYVYHVTTKPNTYRMILSKGFNPQSAGSSFFKEENADKTYAYINALDAIAFFDDKLGEVKNLEGPEYHSWNAFDYPIALLRIDTNKANVDWFFDPESEGLGSTNEWIFTTGFIDSDAIDIIPINKITQTLKQKIWPKFGWSKAAIDKIKMPDDDVFESRIIKISIKHLRTLIKESFNDIDAKIDALPSAGESGWGVNIYAKDVFFNEPKYVVFGLKLSDVKKAKKTIVPANLLIPTQEHLLRDGLKDYVKNTQKELPLVIRRNGEYYVQNHTRVAAQILNGRTNIEVRLLDFERGSYYAPFDV